VPFLITLVADLLSTFSVVIFCAVAQHLTRLHLSALCSLSAVAELFVAMSSGKW